MTERWRPVVGWEGSYEVSDQGRIKSVARQVETSNGRTQRIRERIRVLVPKETGHLAVCFTRGRNYMRVLRVHRIVLEAFAGPCPAGMVALHRNGNPADNRIENLHWGTFSENSLDAVRHGTNSQTRKTHCVQGHPYDEINTIYYTGKMGRRRRICRTCRKQSAHQTYVRRMTRLNEPREPDVAKRQPAEQDGGN